MNCIGVEPVSYTHLDVYKRQGYDRDKLEEYVATKQKIADLKDQLETEQSQLESMQTEYETEESNPVSYTHLDVYKRQASEPVQLF